MSKWSHFKFLKITPLDSLLKFLWAKCDFHKPRMVYEEWEHRSSLFLPDDFVVKTSKTPISRKLKRHNSKWHHFTVFNITPLDFSLKFLWARCNFYKPRMVYERQTYDFVVKNIKKHNFLNIYDVITQNDVILRFLT